MGAFLFATLLLSVSDTAVLELKVERGMDPSLVRLLNEYIVAEYTQRSGLSVITSSDIKAMVGHEAQKQHLGCTDESCLAEIGGALGVSHLLVPNIGKIGSRYVLNFKLLNVRTAGVLSRWSVTVKDDEDALLVGVTNGIAGLLSAWSGAPKLSLPEITEATDTKKKKKKKKRAKKRRKSKEGSAKVGGPPKWLPWTVLGLGAASAGVGIYFGTNAQTVAKERDAQTTLEGYQQRDATAQTSAVVSTATFAVAGVAGATAVGLLIWQIVAKRPEPDVSVGVGPGGVSALIRF